jgi:hypothetical protein
MEFFIPLVGGLIMYLFMQASVRSPGISLAAKFQNLGNIIGVPKTEIVARVGNPNSVSAMGNGQQLCQWLKAGYHISLMFDADGNCLGVTHESSN